MVAGDSEPCDGDGDEGEQRGSASTRVGVTGSVLRSELARIIIECMWVLCIGL